MNTILALMLLCQSNVNDSHFDDLCFVRAVEDSIKVEYKIVFPDELKEHFINIGAKDWKKCDKSSKFLLGYFKEHKSEVYFLFIGRRSKDMEVRLRCNNIIREIFPCMYCDGKKVFGNSPNYTTDCLQCQGCGSIWKYSMFD